MVEKSQKQTRQSQPLVTNPRRANTNTMSSDLSKGLIENHFDMATDDVRRSKPEFGHRLRGLFKGKQPSEEGTTVN